MDSISITTPFWDNLGDTAKGNLHSRQNFGQYRMVINFVWKRKIYGQMCNCSLIRGHWLGWMVRNLGKKHTGRAPQWAKDVRMPVFQGNAHQKVTSSEEFNNQVDCLILLTVSLFPQPSLSLPNGPMNKVAMVAQMEVIH